MKITLNDVKNIIFKNQSFAIDNSTIEKIAEYHEFLKNFANDKIIYGINTGFGPMAQWRVEDQFLKDLQYNIIRSHSTGMGNPLSSENVKAAMIARVGSFIQCKSGIHTDAIKILEFFINNDIIPFIPEHGSVGASGDLVQLAHIALCMIGEGKVLHKGEWQDTAKVMREYKVTPLNIYIREGLSATNGTSVMTGISAINQFNAENLLNLAIIASVWMNEIASSYDDMMSEPLNDCRRHFGQQHIAKEMRQPAKDSKCLIKRERK